MRAIKAKLILPVTVKVKEKGKAIILKKAQIIIIRFIKAKKKEKAVKVNLL